MRTLELDEIEVVSGGLSAAHADGGGGSEKKEDEIVVPGRRREPPQITFTSHSAHFLGWGLGFTQYSNGCITVSGQREVSTDLGRVLRTELDNSAGVSTQSPQSGGTGSVTGSAIIGSVSLGTDGGFEIAARPPSHPGVSASGGWTWCPTP